MNDVVDVMETEEPERVVIPMQPMALKAARADMERQDALNREQDRIEEERENEERGMDQWVDHDVMPEEDTPGEIYLNNTLPVAQVPRLVDYEEMPGIKVTLTRKNTIKEQQEEKRKKKVGVKGTLHGHNN